MRDIDAGEQLQNSYNQCQWCQIYTNPETADWFQVTPQIFELYGFVEFMPQRFAVPHVRLLFDIDEVDEDEADFPGELEVDFVVPPSPAGIQFLHERLHFLREIEVRIKENQSITAAETEGLLSLHSAIVTAFSAALQQAGGQVSNEVWQMGEMWFWESDIDIEEDEEDYYYEDEDDEDEDEDEDYPRGEHDDEL